MAAACCEPIPADLLRAASARVVAQQGGNRRDQLVQSGVQVELVELVQSQRVGTTTLRGATARAVAAHSCATVCKARLGPPPAPNIALDGRRTNAVEISG